MTETKLPYTSFQARTQWYMSRWGPPAFVRKFLMEDGRTVVGVMAFPPMATDSNARNWWTFATNGISERRFPCVEEPHGKPAHRLELIAYANAAADWIPGLLVELGRYAFEHRSGLAVGHTIPVIPKPGNMWSGYLLIRPRLEPDEFNPLGIDIGIGDDWVFLAEIVGLKDDELRLAINVGGPEFAKSVLAGRAAALAIDVDRASLLADA